MLENNQKELILIEDLGMIFPKETSKQKAKFGLYECYCGKKFKTQTRYVKNKITKSCGCLKGINHKLTKNRLYDTWKHMIDRCYNPKNKFYSYYGGNGISVCKEWHTAANFINDMFPSYIEGLTLDRINSSLNYNKDNCRWANKSTQSRNNRKLRINNTSGYKGVSFKNKLKKYIAQISINKVIHLGCFNTAIEAAQAYDNYIINNNLEHTKNF